MARRGRGKRRLVTVGVIFALLLSYRWGRQLCSGSQGGHYDCEGLAVTLTAVLSACAGLLLVFICLISVKRYRKERTAFREGRFSAVPERYDQSVVTVSGKVQRLLKSRPRSAGIIGVVFKKPPAPEKGEAQSLLLSSSDLRKGEYLYVTYRVDEVGFQPKVGERIEVQGVYHHQPSQNARSHKSGTGAETFYGRIVVAPPPQGYLCIFKKGQAKSA